MISAGTVAACERSLRRLKTDHLDCYLLHWRGSYSLRDTFAAFEHLQTSGKILSWGLSNFDESDLEEARRIAGDGKMACDTEEEMGRIDAAFPRGKKPRHLPVL